MGWYLDDPLSPIRRIFLGLRHRHMGHGDMYHTEGIVTVINFYEVCVVIVASQLVSVVCCTL